MLFETVVKLTEMSEDGISKRVRRKFLSEGETCMDVEQKMLVELSGFDPDVISVKVSSIKDIVKDYQNEDVKVFKVRVVFRHVLENGNLKLRPLSFFVVCPGVIDDVSSVVKNSFSQIPDDSNVISIVETKFELV